jgi:hypothetical protein
VTEWHESIGLEFEHASLLWISYLDILGDIEFISYVRGNDK